MKQTCIVIVCLLVLFVISRWTVHGQFIEHSGSQNDGPAPTLFMEDVQAVKSQQFEWRDRIDSLKEKLELAEKRAVAAARVGSSAQLELGGVSDVEFTDVTQQVHRERVRSEVEAAFEARQKLQRGQVNRLREQLARIEKSIEERERIRDKLIDHRVDELLNPALRWKPEDGSQEVSETIDLPEIVPENLESQAYDTPDDLNMRLPSGIGSDLADLTRIPTTLRRTIADHSEEVASLEAIIQHNPKHDNIGGITKMLQTARRNLEFARDELETHTQLLELELKDALSAADAAMKTRDRLTRFGGFVSAQEMSKAQRAFDQTQLRLKRVKVLLEFYGKAGASKKNVTAGNSERRQRTKSRAEYLDVLRKRLRLIDEQYKNGQIGLVDLLTATKALYEAELDTSEDQEAVLQRIVDILKQIRQAVVLQYEAGESSEADVLAIEAELLKTQSQLEEENDGSGRVDDEPIEDPSNESNY